MVNKAEQPEQQPVEQPTDTTTDITEEFVGVDTPPEGTVTQTEETPSQVNVDEQSTSGEDQPTTTEATEQTNAPIPPAAEAPPVDQNTPTQRPPDDLEKRIQQVEQQNLQYKAQQQQAQLTQAKDQYRADLEVQGWLPEQAHQMAEGWAAQQSEVSRLQQEGQQREMFLQGQANAAEHFAKQYDLQLADLSELRKYPDPQSMEQAAKRMKGDRDKDKRIAELESKLVPSQSFDDNQNTPAPSNDEDRWLEKYNQGDRSEQASAAARRAAGLG